MKIIKNTLFVSLNQLVVGSTPTEHSITPTF